MSCVSVPDLFQRTIPEILQISAEKHPDKDAFRCNSDVVSYSELVEKSQRLASVLIQLGVKKEDRVGLFLQQSLESAVAIYGTMLAGAVFVPIDPFSPPLRMQDVMKRCDVSVVITHSKRQAAFLEYLDLTETPLKVVGLENIAHQNVLESVSWEDVYGSSISILPQISVQDLAYIMWTSGSTGSPKGITHTHGNGLIYAGMLTETHGLNENDCFLGLSPLHFDMAVMDYVAAPLVGGTTIIVPEDIAKLPAALTRLVAEQKASVWYSVPFSMVQMLERGAMEKHDLSSLRWMIFGGEPFPIKHLRALMQCLPNAQFANAFGPAETHQISSHTVEPKDLDAGTIPVGKPWRTLDAMILDEEDNVASAGKSGELVVRSPSCMRGYWGDEDQTKASFFHRAISSDMEDLYYRTGDLVRKDTDGMMHFLGRKGRQVKVRGYRIELDEVEGVVLACDGILEGAVIKSADGSHLVAVVRLEEGKVDMQQNLLTHCRSLLPTYAVPSQVRFVEHFARTTSDKIDRNALETELLNANPSDEKVV